MKIWKWELAVTDMQTIFVPEGAKILDVQVQHGKCCLWAICDPDAPKEPRKIAIHGTGNPVPDDPGRHIATFQITGGELVFHAFEIAP